MTKYAPSLPAIPKRRRSYKINRDKTFQKVLLPFQLAPRCLKELNKVPFCNWYVPRIDDISLACRIGQEYAAHLVQYLKDDPSVAPNNILADIVQDIDFDDDSAAKGYWIGFLTELSFYLMEGAKKVDVFEELDKRIAEYERLCAEDEEDALP
jgi:hypothetical protein